LWQKGLGAEALSKVYNGALSLPIYLSDDTFLVGQNTDQS